MKVQKENLDILIDAPGAVVRSQKRLGGMVVALLEVSEGTDLAPILEGLPDDRCTCPHWGYVLKGSAHVEYTGGEKEVVRAGDVFYLPPGHTAWFEEDASIIEFSPEAEYTKVIEHIMSKTE